MLSDSAYQEQKIIKLWFQAVPKLLVFLYSMGKYLLNDFKNILIPFFIINLVLSDGFIWVE